MSLTDVSPQDAATEMLARREARKSLLAFTVYTMPRYGPAPGKTPDRYEQRLFGERLTGVAWHHRELARMLDKVANGECKRLMVFMPPQFGKSELVSRRFPAYLLGRFPNMRIIQASHTDELAKSMNRDVQRIMTDKEYGRLFPQSSILTRPIEENVAARQTLNYFEIPGARGSLRSVGVGKAISGNPADGAVIDDPFGSRADADSPTVRDTVWNWYTNDLFTRLGNPNWVVLTHCVARGQMVAAEAGQVPIEQVTAGSRVWAFDGQKMQLREVESVRSMGTDALLKIKTARGAVLVNARHPFAVVPENGHIRPDFKIEWRQAGELKPNDIVVSMAAAHGIGTSPIPGWDRRGQSMVEGRVPEDLRIDRIKSVSDGGCDEVFDLQIADDSNFVAEGFLVHNTRWNRDDLAGRLLLKMTDRSGDWWDVVNLPAIRDDRPGDPMDPRQPGEALWPDFKSVADLRLIEAQDARAYASLYQQDPTAGSNADFAVHLTGDWMWCQADRWPSYFDKKIICVDASKGRSDKVGDYTAIVFLGVIVDKTVPGGGLLYVDAVIERIPLDQIVRKTILFCDHYKPDYLGIEAEQFQELLVHEFERQCHISENGSPWPLYKMMSRGIDKVTRIRRLSHYVINRELRFKADSPGCRILVDQLMDFPLGDHDDGPDALEMCERLPREASA